MPKITFDSVDKKLNTVTVLLNGEPLTRTLPKGVLSSSEAFEKYMDVYVAGLQQEFPDTASQMADEEIPFQKGHVFCESPEPSGKAESLDSPVV